MPLDGIIFRKGDDGSRSLRLTYSDETVARLEWMRERGGLPDTASVFWKAGSVLGWYLRLIQKGDEFALLRENKVVRTVELMFGEEESPGENTTQWVHTLTLDFDETAWGRLEWMRGQLNRRTPAKVMRDALRVYEYILERLAEGYGFGEVSDGGFVRVIEPF